MVLPHQEVFALRRSILKTEKLKCLAICRTVPKNVCLQMPTELRTLLD